MVNKQISLGHRNFVICDYNSSILFVLHKGASRNLQVNYLLQQLDLRTLSNPNVLSFYHIPCRFISADAERDKPFLCMSSSEF